MMLRSSGRLVLSVLVGCAIGACGGAPEAGSDRAQLGTAEPGQLDSVERASNGSVADELATGTTVIEGVPGATQSPQQREVPASRVEAGWCDAPLRLEATAVQALTQQVVPTGRGPSLACVGTDGVPVAYALQVPRGYRAKVTAVPRTPGLALILQVSEGCESRVCLAQAGAFEEVDRPAELRLDNDGQDTLSTILTVNSQSSAIGGRYDLIVYLDPLEQPRRENDADR